MAIGFGIHISFGFSESDIQNDTVFYEQANQLIIETSPKRNAKRIYGIFFLSFWLIAWLASWQIVWMMGQEIIKDVSFNHFVFYFLSLWSVLWIIGGIYAFNIWKYLIWGNEKVIFNKEKLIMIKNHKIFDKERVYESIKVRKFQARLRKNSALTYSQWLKLGNREMDLIFFYDKKKIKFAQKIHAKNAFLFFRKIKAMGLLREDSFKTFSPNQNKHIDK